MNLNDILTLARAGFTADQISKISKLRNPEKPAQDQPAPSAPPAPPTPPAPPAPPAQPENDVSAQIAALTAAIQANAIVQSKQPKTETVDDILASIIDPRKDV